jgi:hypothetical protein
VTTLHDSGAMSVDFLIGFTVFILAFVWIATMIPGMLVGLHATNIDYDAVAYRTSVILVEDPGWPETPGWETKLDEAKDMDIIRFGLAVRKDSPNILSQNKIDRFFNLSTPAAPSVGFTYPDDYQPRAIFGDYPYKFNISLRDIQREKFYSVGDILPQDTGTSGSRVIEYGYMRRLVKIKTSSNASINMTDASKKNYYLNTTPLKEVNNVTMHKFAVLLNVANLKDGVRDTRFSADASHAHDPAYLIDPVKDILVINITNINKTLNIDQQFDCPICTPPSTSTKIYLMNISLKANEGGISATKLILKDFVIDGVPRHDENAFYNGGAGYQVAENVSVILDPSKGEIAAATVVSDNQISVNYTFVLTKPSAFLNTTNSTPFEYNYDPTNVTQPALRDGILEVAVW